MRNLISGVIAFAIEDKIVVVNPAARSRKDLKAARTGLRQGELTGLRWDDIDWNVKFPTVKRTMYLYRKQADFA